MSPQETLLWGIFGGAGAEVAILFALRHQNPAEFPFWIRSWVYYLIVVLMVLVGGGMALAYSRSGTDLSPILAVQIGASTPLILRKLRDAAPETPSRQDVSRID